MAPGGLLLGLRANQSGELYPKPRPGAMLAYPLDRGGAAPVK